MQRDNDSKEVCWSIEDTVKAKVRLRQEQPVSRFDPYQGAMSTKPPSRKRDLRKIGEWIEAKRRAEQLKREESGD
jgi:hypothetical protein